MNYRGVIIEESLDNKRVLKKIKIISTKVECVTPKHQTPWLSQWTLHTVEIPKNEARILAQEIRQSLDSSHSTSWYADFKNNTRHYIIFREKIFLIDLTSTKQYAEVKHYGMSLGIPEYQVDFSPIANQQKP